MPFVTAYNPLPISFTHGKGIWLYSNNEAYLDSFAGIAVCGLGHAHPEVTKTIQNQAQKLLHTSNAFRIEAQEKLAKKLTSLTGMQQVFFSNSGAEANESAIKLCRLFAHKKHISNPKIVVMERSFHGRTLATLSASCNKKIQKGFAPIVPGFLHVCLNDIEAIKKLASSDEHIVAVMLEPIQGEGGIRLADSNYLQELAKICHEKDWLLVLDEIQTGVGRTGALYDFMHHKIEPDIVTSAKALGNGIPIGACLINNRAKDLFQPGNHGSTFGGNPLACSTALTVLEVLENQNIYALVQKNSSLLRDLLEKHLSKSALVTDIRGRGFMIGVELTKPAIKLKEIGLKHNILINITSEKVIRLLPPLIISSDEIHELVARLIKSIDKFSEL